MMKRLLCAMFFVMGMVTMGCHGTPTAPIPCGIELFGPPHHIPPGFQFEICERIPFTDLECNDEVTVENACGPFLEELTVWAEEIVTKLPPFLQDPISVDTLVKALAGVCNFVDSTIEFRDNTIVVAELPTCQPVLPE
jgi:hypothetical protein